MNSKTCHCHSGKNYAECCAPYLAGSSIAPDPESLMRSRYSAFVERNNEYLLRTWHVDTRPAEIEDDGGTEWLGLKILETTGGGDGEKTGTVTFIARLKQNGTVGSLHERSDFSYEADGCWYYVDGVIPVQSPVTHKKIGRNEPCPCGSGKKYKRCCGR